ncbi:aminotransferase class V-fold PLP-dependent enzyme [Phaeobacter marinintestinus]|uniref:aminotransferase class V-fold PLP-dependent enzyme n=1 Tax=Falsiphaeobacter marinintestinus TaxID=1492905 RepID=UPI0011B735E9|nr:aminotransferase class V-fold PLP-dependent enzyme [Phaeobacter marinintestinus]
MPLSHFRSTIEAATHTGTLQDGVIGEGMMIPGLYGDVPLTYADYVASGRAMRQVEEFVMTEVLPFYANSHTESSFCGAHVTGLRRAARAEIARLVGAGHGDAVIFTGSGATAGLNRLVTLLGIPRADQAVVFVGPYEHHSNLLPWRESGAQVVEITEGPQGGPDLDALKAALIKHASSDLLIGSFSAASNVTGIITDPDPVSRLLKAHGALSVWDYAGGGPYLPMDMARGTDAQKDAIVVSPHKFPGGPGASGVLIVNRDAATAQTPSWPGGGTVSFVSPWGHEYSDSLEAREEAGTPNVIGDIRAALAFIVKDVVGQGTITSREATYNDIALEGWADNPHLTLLGVDDAPHRLPIFSFVVRDAAGQPVNPLLVTRMLSDIYGIQARGGCSCAGPYGHKLLGIDRETSDRLRDSILSGQTTEKPGWVRLNFSYMMDETTVRRIVDAVNQLSHTVRDHARHYQIDPSTGTVMRIAQAA